MACLGDVSRFRVVMELLAGEGRCVSDVARAVGLSQSCTTRHLQVLEREGLVKGIRSGKRVLYRVSGDPKVAALLDWAIPGENAAPTAEHREEPSGPSPQPSRRRRGGSKGSANHPVTEHPQPTGPFAEIEDFLL